MEIPTFDIYLKQKIKLKKRNPYSKLAYIQFQLTKKLLVLNLSLCTRPSGSLFVPSPIFQAFLPRL